MNFQRIFTEAIQQTAAELPMSLADLPAYQEKLANWHRHAGVRTWSPGLTSLGSGSQPFSADLVPLSRNELVCDRGVTAQHHIQAQHLYRFCNFTEHLELEAVVPTCTSLHFGQVPFGIPDGLARDTGAVILDEVWHARCAEELRAKMQAQIGVIPCRQRQPAFLHVLRIVKRALTGEQQWLADLVFTCVSETLITGSLTKVPRDEQVLSAVRDVLGEHAREEKFHHSIFGQVIGVMWEQLTSADRDVAGPLFAIFIAAFLRPDMLAELDALESAGFTAAEAKKIMEDTHGEAILTADLWRVATPTVQFMRRHGLLEHNATRETLEEMALIAAPGTPNAITH